MKGRRSAKRSTGRPASRATAGMRSGDRAGRPGKSEGDSPVLAYIASLPASQRAMARRLDDLVAREVPGVRRAIKWVSRRGGRGPRPRPRRCR